MCFGHGQTLSNTVKHTLSNAVIAVAGVELQPPRGLSFLQRASTVVAHYCSCHQILDDVRKARHSQEHSQPQCHSGRPPEQPRWDAVRSHPQIETASGRRGVDDDEEPVLALTPATTQHAYNGGQGSSPLWRL